MKPVEHYKTVLTDRRRELMARLIDIEEELDQPAPADAEDRATEREGDEVLEGLGHAGIHEVEMIDAALARIEKGTFGQCASCGEDISEQRLDVLPFTPLCRTCAAAHQNASH